MLGVLLIILACLLWALDTLIRYPLIEKGIDAQTIVFTEHLLLTLFFIPLLIKRYRIFWNAKVSHMFYFLFIGAIGSALATLSFTKAFFTINPSLVILLQKFQPIVAISLATIVLKEPIKKRFIWWAILCIIGGLMISYRDIFPGLTKIDFNSGLLSNSSLVGYGLALIAVIGWGSSTVFGKKLSSEGFKGSEIMAGRFTIGLLFLLPLVVSSGVALPKNLTDFGQIAFMVAMSGLLGMYLYYLGLKRVSARLCALAEMFFPFCAIVINWVFLGATLDLMQISGAAMLLVGSTMIQIKHY